MLVHENRHDDGHRPVASLNDAVDVRRVSRDDPLLDLENRNNFLEQGVDEFSSAVRLKHTREDAGIEEDANDCSGYFRLVLRA